MSYLSFSTANRGEFINNLSDTDLDVLIVGGGSTGTGIALDSASRGYTTGLIEMEDFASGTSSKSTKLIHGGLRYLKNLDFKLVRETGLERTVVHSLARHLVIPEKMLLPIVEGGSYNKVFTSIGLKVYDFLADVEKEDRRIMLTREETMEMEPLLDKPDLTGGTYYAEYRTDDARLTIEIAKSAYRHGATLLNYAKCIEILKKDGTVTGIRAKDLVTNDEFVITAKKVVIAAGHWSEEVKETKKSLGSKKLFLTKGVHIVFPQERLPLKRTVYFDVGDGRMIFAIPRDGITYVGTTDTHYTGAKDEVKATKSDVAYLLKAITFAFPSIDLIESDIISSWAGLRTLMYEEGKSPSEMSRHEEVFVSDEGLISVAGGKLTGYRKIAEKVVDMVVDSLWQDYGLPNIRSRTEQIHLTNPHIKTMKELGALKKTIGKLLSRWDLPAGYDNYLVRTYGLAAKGIVKIGKRISAATDLEKIVLAQLKYGVENEMVRTPIDFFERRTGMVYFDPNTIAVTKDIVLKWFSELYNWDTRTLNSATEMLDNRVSNSTDFD